MRKALASLALLLSACGPAVEGPATADLMTPVMLEPPPIYSLLGYRSDLELTSEQITRLDSIAEAARAENTPLADELRATAQRRSRNSNVIVLDGETRPLAERLHENNRRAGERVQEVLTEEQQARVCRLYEQDRPRQPTRSARPMQPSRRRGVRADTVAFGSRPVWPWCVEDGGPTESP